MIWVLLTITVAIIAFVVYILLLLLSMARLPRTFLSDNTVADTLVQVSVTWDEGLEVISIEASENSSFVILSDGSLWGWGFQSHGQLGNDMVDREWQAVPIWIMNDVASVSASVFHTMVIKSDGSLWGWGDNRFGQLVNDERQSQPIPMWIMDDVIWMM